MRAWRGRSPCALAGRMRNWHGHVWIYPQKHRKQSLTETAAHPCSQQLEATRASTDTNARHGVVYARSGRLSDTGAP